MVQGLRELADLVDLVRSGLAAVACARAHVPAGNLSIRPTSGEASRPPFASFALLLLIILTRKVIRLDGLRLQLPLHLDVKASRDTRGWA